MINTQNVIEMLIIAAITIISITIHEFSHGYVSYMLGDDTPKVYRRLTLNPLKHLDVIGAICLAIFHFGWAKPVPVNPNNYKNKKLGVLAVSLAGPISNILLAFIATVLYVFVPEKNVYFNTALLVCVSLNFSLAVFNLLPIPPLDGSRIVSILLPQRARNKYNAFEKYSPFVIFFIFLVPVLGSVLTAFIDFISQWIFKGFIIIISFVAGLF